MTNLARASGNTALDPKRFAALGDSLTTVSKMSGASASSILSFSKNIGPMANAAGIGATGVLGISSAFARLGEDGFGASTAVNKMLTDMSRSVREGGPQMRNYAEIVGKSATEFERLYKANPTEALTQVTEAIASAGDRGPRMLEQIGVEGVRGQRALQALSASGGLRQAVATATGAYGTGSTETAAEAAFGGLNDSMTELRESTTQVSEAMGAPLLGPLTKFADVLKVPIELLGKLIGSGGAQAVLGAAAYGGVGVMATRAIFRPLAAAGLTRQAVTSTPLRALAAGIAQGRGLTPETSRLARFGAPIMAAGEEGRLGRYGQRFLDVGTDIGTGMGPATPGAGTLRQRAFGAATAGAQLNWNMLTGQLSNAALNDPTRRTPVGFQAGPAFEGGWKEFRSSFQPGGGGINAGLKNFNTRLLEAGRDTNAFRRTLVAGARVGVGAGAAGARLGADVGRLAGRGIGAAGSFLGPGALLTGGIAAIGMGLANREAQKQEIVDRGQMDIRGTINSYRESIGVATAATSQLGSQMEQLGKSVALTTTSFSDARDLTEKDIAVATSGSRKVQTRFAGTNRQVAAQISGLDVNGLSPAELKAVGIDLVRGGMSEQRAEAILAQVDTTGGGARGGGGGIASMVRGAASSERGGFKGLLAKAQGSLGGSRGQDDFLFGQGGMFHVDELGKAGKDQLNVIAGNIRQRYEDQSGRFGVDYARQSQARDMEKAIKTAMKEGNYDLADQLSKTFSQQITGKEGGVDLSIENMERYGFMGALRREDKGARETYAGVDMEGRGLRAREQQGYFSELAAAAGEKEFAAFYDNRTRGGVGQAVQQALTTPEDAKAVRTAVDVMTASMSEAGKGFDEIAISSIKAAEGMSTESAAYQLQRGVQARAEQQMGVQAIGMTGGQRIAQQLSYSATQMRAISPTDPTRAGQLQQAEATHTEMLGAAREAMANRLQMQRQYELQYDRAFEDFNKAQEYAEQDYIRARFRAQRNFNTQIERLREDAAKTLYNPYERIMTAPTWDTNNLLVNAKEQTQALEKQSRQLDQLRRAGVSRQAIDTLELYKPENAQQLNTMTQDLLDSPQLRQRLNDQMAKRGRAAGDLATDTSNTDVRRMRQDFSRGMSDMAKDMDRARERNQESFDKSISRMAEDLARAQESIAGNAPNWPPRWTGRSTARRCAGPSWWSRTPR